MRIRTAWIHSVGLDVPFVLAPPFVLLAVVWLFPQVFGAAAEFTEWHWLGLVLLIDVAHVYSTIYRTYLDPGARKHYRSELTWLPVMAFILMVVVHSLSMLWFWRALAYLAVFHFVRQQYGFMRLYQRGEKLPDWKNRIDTITIYAATLAPLLHWHLSYPRAFNWFMPDDMLGFRSPIAAQVVLWCYAMLLAVYVLSEIRSVHSGRPIDLPKNLLMAGTVISWYMGIVYFNGDVTFTLFNVVAHGVPYMALVWAFGRKRNLVSRPVGSLLHGFFSLRAIPLYLGLLFLLAFLEEGLWDAFVWREGRSTFKVFNELLPAVSDPALLSILVPLLALPQVTHYMIDAFIWRMRKEGDRDGWQSLIFGGSSDGRTGGG